MFKLLKKTWINYNPFKFQRKLNFSFKILLTLYKQNSINFYKKLQLYHREITNHYCKKLIFFQILIPNKIDRADLNLYIKLINNKILIMNSKISKYKNRNKRKIIIISIIIKIITIKINKIFKKILKLNIDKNY